MRKAPLVQLLVAFHAACSASPVRTADELAAVNRGKRTEATAFELTATLVREGARENTEVIAKPRR